MEEADQTELLSVSLEDCRLVLDMLSLNIWRGFFFGARNLSTVSEMSKNSIRDRMNIGWIVVLPGGGRQSCDVTQQPLWQIVISWQAATKWCQFKTCVEFFPQNWDGLLQSGFLRGQSGEVTTCVCLMNKAARRPLTTLYFLQNKNALRRLYCTVHSHQLASIGFSYNFVIR